MIADFTSNLTYKIQNIHGIGEAASSSYSKSRLIKLHNKIRVLKQDWISPWSRLVWWVCAALVRSVSRRTATCRERARWRVFRELHTF